MVIAFLKRQAFKLPLPGYTNGARAMERCYNGLHIKWHPITTFICGEVEQGSNDSLLLISDFAKEAELIRRRVKEPHSTVLYNALSTCLNRKSNFSVTMQNVRSISTHARDVISPSTACYDWGFPWTASPDKMEHSPVPPGPHHRRTPKVHESCHLFKCESARKSYLKDYLMAASSLAEPKGQPP